MVNLLLHCGSRHVDREQIQLAPTPARTKTWVPVPHHRLLQQVEHTLQGCDMEIVNEAHGLWGDGARYFGLLEVQNGEASGDYGLVVGLRNSHDKSFPAGVAIGAAVFCCDNLSFSGEVTLARRHTEWRQPSHREFEEGGHTAWRLFNAFTETTKGTNLAVLPKRTRALHGLLDAACGLSLAN